MVISAINAPVIFCHFVLVRLRCKGFYFHFEKKSLKKSAISLLTNQFKIERMKGSNHLAGLVILVFIITVSFVNCWPVQVKAQGVKTGNQVNKEALAANLIVITIDGQRWQETFTGVEDALIDSSFVKSSVDALRQKFWNADKAKRRQLLMPNLWNSIVGNGRLYGNRNEKSFVNVTNPYRISYPGYNEIFTGYPDTLINANDYPDNPNDNVLEYINKQPGFEGRVAAFTAWSAFPRILNQKRSGFPLHVIKDDGQLFNEAKKYIQKHRPRVCYMALTGPDHYAHKKRYDLYADAIHRADSIIGETWKLIRSDNFYRNKTTLLITVDHGRGLGKKWSTHNAKRTSDSNQIWFAVAGAGVRRPYGEMKNTTQLYQNQFARTMAALLGLNYISKKHASGPPVNELMSMESQIK